jgi:iron complex outermembrane receptor protein
MQGDPARSAAQAADINNIPAALIQRIDVVTGGASAVYGSDALAGVVNFMLKRDFEGVQLDAQGGVYMHENGNAIAAAAKAAGQTPAFGRELDGEQQSYSLTAGKNFAEGRGNVTGFFSYKNIEGVGTKDRDFSTCNLSATATGYACSLSSATYPVQFQLTNPDHGRDPRQLRPGGQHAADLSHHGRLQQRQHLRPAVARQALQRRPVRPLRDLAKADVYGEFMFMRDEADIKLSPTAVFTVSERINCNNPLMSAQEKNLICTSVGLTDAQSANVIVSQRNALGGSRHDYTDHTSYRGVAGLRGDLTSHWRYDVYAQYGRTDYSSRLTGDYSLAKFANALRAVTNSQRAGRLRVRGQRDRSGLRADQPVPGRRHHPGRAELRAERRLPEGLHRGERPQRRPDRRPGLTSPLASYPIGVAIGAEYRKEKISFQPDTYYSSRDVAGNSGGEFPIAGSFDVKEAYGEIRVPLVENKPFFKSLSVEGGVRYSDYSTAGDTWAYKGGGEWTPISDIRLRASYQRAVRAPNLVELFGPQRVVTAAITDPCEGATPKATAAQCALSGVTADPVRRHRAGGGPAVGRHGRRQPEPGSGNLEHQVVRRPAAAALPAGPERLGRLFRHRREEADHHGAGQHRAEPVHQRRHLVRPDQAQRRDRLAGDQRLRVTTSINAGYLKTKGLDFAASYAHDLPELFGETWAAWA